jgi:hypothetical protein
MEILEEYGIQTFLPPPWLMRKNRWLGELWNNPVFQRRYLAVKVGKSIGFERGFFIGTVLSILAIIGKLIINWFDPTPISISWASFQGLLALIDLPILSIFTLIAGVRLFILGLIRTPIDMSNSLTPERSQALIISPMTDEEIFYGEITAPFTRGLIETTDVTGVFIGMLGSAFISLVLLKLFNASQVRPEDINTLLVVTLGYVICCFSFIVYVTALTFASSRMSLYMSPVAAIIMGFIIVWFISSILSALGGLLILPFMKDPGSDLNSILTGIFRIPLAGFMLQVIGLTLFSWIMAKDGVKRLGDFRRDWRKIY